MEGHMNHDDQHRQPNDSSLSSLYKEFCCARKHLSVAVPPLEPRKPTQKCLQKFIRKDVEQDAASCGNLDDPLKFKVMEQWPLNTLYAQAERLFGDRN